MRPSTVLKLFAVTLGCAVLVSASAPTKTGGRLPANAAAIRVTTGNTFALVPTDDPTIFDHPVDGVAQVSLLGNCHFHGESTVHLPTTPNQPIVIVSTSPWTLTSSDGRNSLRFDAEGTATFDPSNPNFANLIYKVTFVGGSGAFVNATGEGTMDVTAEFTSALGGLANWTLKGTVITPPQKD